METHVQGKHNPTIPLSLMIGTESQQELSKFLSVVHSKGSAYESRGYSRGVSQDELLQ